MDVVDRTKVQEPFGGDQTSYGHFGQDQRSAHAKGHQVEPSAESDASCIWLSRLAGAPHPFQAICVLDKWYHFLDSMCPDVKIFVDPDRLQSGSLILSIRSICHPG